MERVTSLWSQLNPYDHPSCVLQPRSGPTVLLKPARNVIGVPLEPGGSCANGVKTLEQRLLVVLCVLVLEEFNNALLVFLGRKARERVLDESSAVVSPPNRYQHHPT